MPRRAPRLNLFLLAGLWGVVFFSVSGCKRAVYLLPALPPLALALGAWLDAILPRPAPRGVRLAAAAGCLTTFLLALGWVCFLLPAHHQNYTLREQVRRAARVRPDVPVLCYPRRWDSVSFYLDRNDVRAYAPGQLHELVADLQVHRRAVVFVKQSFLEELRQALPQPLELIARERALGVEGVVAVQVGPRVQGGS